MIDSYLLGSLAFNEKDKLNLTLTLPSGASLHGKSVEPCLRLIRFSIIRKWTQMEQNINMTCDARWLLKFYRCSAIYFEREHCYWAEVLTFPLLASFNLSSLPGQGQMLCYVRFFVSIKWKTDICELFLLVVLIEVILV